MKRKLHGTECCSVNENPYILFITRPIKALHRRASSRTILYLFLFFVLFFHSMLVNSINSPEDWDHNHWHASNYSHSGSVHPCFAVLVLS